jgi:hypothetical protein
LNETEIKMKISVAIGVGVFVAAGVALATPAHADAICAKGVVALGETSCPFALEVANAYRTSTINPDGGLLRGVYSPTTGQYYDMNCSKLGAGVLCRGGNGAEVNIF